MARINVSLLETLDSSIKSGHAKSVKETLRDLKAKHVPDSLLGFTVKILNRCGLPKKAIALLDPVVYPEDTLGRSPTNIELAEYGSALNQIGAYNDALNIFKEVSVKAAPMVELYHALTLFNRFEYAKAIPLLQSFSENPQISVYERFMGKVYLVEAYLAEQKYTQSFRNLNDIEAYAKKNNFKFLLGRGLELRGQALVKQSDFQMGAKFLESAAILLKNASLKNQLVVEKWLTIANMGLTGGKNSLLKLRQVKLNAVELDHWKTVRECDFYEALFTRNDELFMKVYFGTPFDAFRTRLKAIYNDKIVLPETYLWNPMEAKISPKEKINANIGLEFRSGEKLKTGHLLHRLFHTLASDFYVPFRTETLFNFLFPEEHFHPQSSNNRVYFALARLSQWFNKLKIPVEVRHQPSGYRLYITKPYGIEVSLQSQSDLSLDVVEQLKKRLPMGEGFSAAVAAKLLDIPHRTVNRKLQRLVNEGRLICKGAGPSTRYYFN
ncbi:MAG: hypothetical protein SGJ18_05675 [Pseudomonadota bacterium]|nr:hypothetical protein [Pseudomonadota bacterium]